MNFTYDMTNATKARREYLYNGSNTSRNDKIFVRSINKLNFLRENGTRIAQTLRAPGDYVGGRDYSQYVSLKSASRGNGFVGN